MSQNNAKPSSIAIAIVVIGSLFAGAGIFLALAVVKRPARVASAAASPSVEPAPVVLSAATLATLAPSMAETAPPLPTTTSAPATTKQSGSTTPGWDPHSRFECWGTDNYTFDGVSANLAGMTVVDAKGTCKLHLSHCTLTGDVAVQASGGAEVTLDHCTLTGRRAIDATGSSHVVLHDTTTHGQIAKLGAARIDL